MYIYIYIHISLTHHHLDASQSWEPVSPPSFCNKRQNMLVEYFDEHSCFIEICFSHLCPFPPCSSSLPVFLDTLKPKLCPNGDVSGICIYIHTQPYIYICRRVIFGTIFGLSRVRNSTTFKKKIILTAARSKSRVRNRPTGELETVPPQRPFFCTSRWYCS